MPYSCTRTRRAVSFLLVAVALWPTGCAFHALGRAPDDVDLKNDGAADEQAALYHRYETVYERGHIRRPSADPVAVAAEIRVPHVDDVAAPAWSDDAYNYLATSDDAAKLLENPAVSFDGFAHSGTGELVIMSLGAGGGLLGGVVAWYLPTRVVDGVNDRETEQLYVNATAGLTAGIALGAILSTAYTYIVPALSTPLAAPQYRAAVRAFNDELDDRIHDNGPAEESADAADAAGTPATTDDAPAEQPAEQPAAPTAPPPPETPAAAPTTVPSSAPSSP